MPQLPFIGRVLASSVASERQGSQCKLYRCSEIPQRNSWDDRRHARWCVAVHRQGVVVPRSTSSNDTAWTFSSTWPKVPSPTLGTSGTTGDEAEIGVATKHATASNVDHLPVHLMQRYRSTFALCPPGLTLKKTRAHTHARAHARAHASTNTQAHDAPHDTRSDRMNESMNNSDSCKQAAKRASKRACGQTPEK